MVLQGVEDGKEQLTSKAAARVGREGMGLARASGVEFGARTRETAGVKEAVTPRSVAWVVPLAS